MAYISTAESEDLQGICYPRTEQAEHLAVVCALIPKSPAVRDAALTAVDKAVSSDTLMLSERISALLEAYSEENDDSMGFAWSPSAGETVRAKLQRVFNTAQPILLESASDASQVNVLRRAASLFPTLDREQALQHVAKNRKRSTLTENTIALIDALVEDSDDASTPEMKGWFLMAFDHLTRRFAEDAVLAPKVTTFAKALGKFLARREVTLDKLVPRSTLNAALEAGLQKHIAIPEVVCFATNVVVLSSPKSLDLAKLLQIVLGHPENPLAFLDTIYEPQDIHHYLAFLILKLFQAGKAALCNIATLDGVMALYRGTNNFIDGVLLKIITRVEGHLTRSCASRVSSWSVLGSTEKPLISRVRGRLEVAINGKMLAKSVFHFIPTSIAAEEEDFDTLDSYLQAIKDNTLPVGKAYDPRFLLPALTFCVFSDAQILDAQAAVERHCLAYALTGLSSTSAAIRSMAIGFLNALASKLEDSAYRGKTQLNHLVLSILASLQTSPQEPLPAAMSIFLAQASQVLANPTHFLYEKVMQLLLRSPLLQLHDIPLMLSTAHVDGNENAHKEVAWILNVLSAGIKSPQDLLLYRKRNVFGNVLALYASPNATERTREKVVELLWNAAAVEGAGTTLITRNGVVAWIEQQLGTQLDGGVELKRLLARLWEGAHKTHVKEWSRGAVGAHFVAAVV
ncbi:hypothetical protein FN846DRAFT_898598 [Sphaerosporella brunnea]|uniref:URB1 C-terminal domain-containing protein n=1 Tax=Sphaerosporella brunnea TaxID=1250544 RepID=A0A5J5F077_9PEZI|nr:hypothetical protein FN846DRAFT_898598 [Sphaerosporella brunnea]